MDLTAAAATVNYLAVIAAALVTFLVGGVWYSPLLFDKPWRGLNALTEAQIKAGHTGLIFGLSFLAALVGAFVLALFLAGPTTDAVAGLMAGLLVGVGWVATAMLTTFLFERRPLALWGIDAAYHVLTFGLMGLIIGLWR
ncbi:MAG TPA: DUF1761 domain-containing protein [Chloroflexota bacterium]|nr:DUF1761 domain-containing protein [Chloroflexota bacterium]